MDYVIFLLRIPYKVDLIGEDKNTYKWDPILILTALSLTCVSQLITFESFFLPLFRQHVTAIHKIRLVSFSLTFMSVLFCFSISWLKHKLIQPQDFQEEQPENLFDTSAINTDLSPPI